LSEKNALLPQLTVLGKNLRVAPFDSFLLMFATEMWKLL
jgi:hypothetical protein